MHTRVAPGNDPAVLNRYAKAAGVAMLLSIVFGFIGEMYLPRQIIVRGDAAATAANLLADPSLIRVTFAAYLVEGICDVLLAALFYVLLRPVDRNLALISAFFGLVSMLMFAVAQTSFFSASLAVRDTAGMDAFSAEQRSALAYLAIRISTTTAGLFLCMYGIASMIRGYLIARSWYLPKVLGALFVIGGAGFFLRSITWILAPAVSSPIMLIPMAVAGIPLMLWLLIRGVDVHAFQAENPRPT